MGISFKKIVLKTGITEANEAASKKVMIIIAKKIHAIFFLSL
jgi:hypothetical protein